MLSEYEAYVFTLKSSFKETSCHGNLGILEGFCVKA